MNAKKFLDALEWLIESKLTEQAYERSERPIDCVKDARAEAMKALRSKKPNRKRP